MQLKLRIFYLVFTYQFLIGATNGLPEEMVSHISKLGLDQGIEYLAKQCWSNREVNTGLAVAAGEAGLAMSIENGREKSAGQIYNYLGAIYLHYLHRTDEALPYLHKGFQISSKMHDSVSVGYAYNNLGDAFFKAGNMPIARDYANKSLEVFRDLKHPLGIAYGYINLGYINRFEKKGQEAHQNFMDAIAIRETIADSLGIASAYLEIAINYNVQGEVDSAFKYFNESFEKQKTISNKTWMAYALNGIGNIHNERNNPDAAIENFNQALKLNSARNNYFGMIDNYLGLAVAFSLNQFQERSEAYIDSAIAIAEEFNFTGKLKDCHKTRIRIHVLAEESPNTFESIDQFLYMYDSLYSIQQYETLEEVQARFNMERDLKDAEDAIIVEKNKQVYLAVISFLLLLVAAILLWRYISYTRMNRELKSTIQARNTLMSIISHDLRGPIGTRMVMMQEFLRQFDSLSAADLKDYLKTMENGISKTYDLLISLLEWSRFQSGDLQYLPERKNLMSLVTKVTALLEDQAALKNVSVDLEVDEGIEILADSRMFNEVLKNLVENAIKFSKPGEGIIISAEATRKQVYIKVKDNGVGIPEKHHAGIFSVGNKLMRKGTAGETSTGFGLILVKELVSKWDGSLTLESVPAQGTTITFNVPAAN